MKKKVVVIAVLTTIVAVGAFLGRAGADTKHHGLHGTANKLVRHAVKPETTGIELIYSQHLPAALASIEKALKAVESDNKRVALNELRKAQRTLATVSQALAKHLKPAFVNTRCPIMDSPINPKKVTKTLIRDYNGQKLAFCCAGCPSAWDKLTNLQKQAKLAKASTPKTVWTCSMHPQIKLSRSGSCPICSMTLIQAPK